MVSFFIRGIYLMYNNFIGDQVKFYLMKRVQVCMSLSICADKIDYGFVNKNS